MVLLVYTPCMLYSSKNAQKVISGKIQQTQQLNWDHLSECPWPICSFGWGSVRWCISLQPKTRDVSVSSHLGWEWSIKLGFKAGELESVTFLHPASAYPGVSLTKHLQDWNALVWILFIFHYNYIAFNVLKNVKFLGVFLLAWQFMLKKTDFWKASKGF